MVEREMWMNGSKRFREPRRAKFTEGGDRRWKGAVEENRQKMKKKMDSCRVRGKKDCERRGVKQTCWISCKPMQGSGLGGAFESA